MRGVVGGSATQKRKRFRMFETSILTSVPAVDAVDQARRQLEREGLAGVGAALAPFEGLAAAEVPGLTGMLACAIGLVTEGFRADTRSAEAYAAIASVPPALAALMFDLMLEGIFGDGPRNITTLNEVGLLTLVGLLSSAGAHEQAAALLVQARELGSSPGLTRATWVARCRWAGCSSDVAAHMVPANLGFADVAAVLARIDSAPLDIAAHRARVRFALRATDMGTVTKAIGVALSLPLADGEKMDLVPEIALFAALLAATGELSALGAHRLRWAFAVAPGVIAAAADLLARLVAEEQIAFLDPAEAEAAVTQLRSVVVPATLPAVTAYPMRGGKPHVDIVWLEITNHCNQKCTFCPDMFREDARTWLPLQQVKDLIDQLADTISVGSMQLNAYGEPLLHPNIAEILAYYPRARVAVPDLLHLARHDAGRKEAEAAFGQLSVGHRHLAA